MAEERVIKTDLGIKRHYLSTQVCFTFLLICHQALLVVFLGVSVQFTMFYVERYWIYVGRSLC